MKWEYAVFDLKVVAFVDGLQSLAWQHVLEPFGKEGWELVSVDNDIAYFKRPIPDPAVYRDGLKLDFPYKGTYE